jgi:hypothetical protein
MNQWDASREISPDPEDPEGHMVESYATRKNKGVRVCTAFSSDLLKHWAVIVETWEHKNYGRGKRLYLQTFTDAERKTISAYHGRLWNWTMRRGFPDEVIMSLATYELMNRAANFFASI